MKINELQLLAYGPFTDTTLDLSGGDGGLHIIYGPNEAGKSSTLRAIHGLLYGIPTKTSDNFKHDNKKLLIGGRLTNRDGREIHFHRRKGNKSTLLNPSTAKGTAYPDDALEPFLTGIDQDAFSRIYGIGNEQLEDGGREMAALKGLVGESLFAATVGPGLAPLMTRLDSEAADIFESRKRSATLKTLGTRHKELTSGRRNVLLAKSRWERLQSDLTKAREHRDEILAREKQLSIQLQRLKRLKVGLPLISKLRNAKTSIEELAGAKVLPTSYSAEERNQAQIELASVQRQIQQLQASLDGDSGYQSQLDAIAIPDGLLDFEDTISELKDQRAVTLSAESDKTQLQREIKSFKQQADDILRDLGFDEPLENAERLRVRSEDQIVIQNLASDAIRLREQPQTLARQREEVERTIESLREELGNLSHSGDIEGLETAVDQTADADRLTEELKELRSAHAQLSRSANDRLATLGLWKGSLADATTQTLPLPESVEQYRDRLADLTQQRTKLEDDRESLQNQLDETRRAIATLQTEGSVPTEAELSQLRSDRDADWQKVRDDWLRGAFNKAMPVEKAEALAANFAAAVNTADHMADRLRRETERVTKLANHVSRQQLIVEQQQRLATTQEALDEQTKSANTDWLKLWKPTGIKKPLSPTEMLSWLRRFDELRETAASISDCATNIQQVESRLEAIGATLREALQSAGSTSPKVTSEPLTELRRLARTAITEREEAQKRHDDLTAELKRSENEFARLTTDEERATVELAAWQESWSEWMTKIGCEESAIAEQVNARLSSLSSLFELVRRMRDAQARVDEIDAETQQFDRDVREIANRFLPDNDFSATEAAVELDRILREAKSDRDHSERLSETLHNANVELVQLRKSAAEWTHRLDLLCQLAGVTDVAALPAKERESSELSELVRRRNELGEQLHEQAGGQSLDEFVADAETVAADELPNEIDRLVREIERLQEDREAAAIAVSDLEKEAAEADGNDQAAHMDQQALGVLSTMHDEARRYMQLRLAATMLRNQIDIHRSENEDPLLQRASQLFATMTCGEYSGLRTDYENDQPVIVGCRQGDDVVPVPGMSDGTRNQLFLALRLGYVEHQLVKFEPMPFIVDDILIHFDDDRSTATLQVLSELAAQTQVIFLTHHRHLVQLAKTNVSESRLFIHDLDSRNRKRTRKAKSKTRSRPR